MPTIIEVIKDKPEFSILSSAITAVGLIDSLSNKGPFTIFAPTNDAFDKAFKAMNITAEQLLLDKETLTKVLTYHVVSGSLTSKDLMNMTTPFTLKTLEGNTIKLTNNNGVSVDGAKVTSSDIEASNGVIHIIDNVIMPQDK